MIRLIEAMNYRSLKRIRQPLEPFHVLVGPNASGKSTFLDVLAFLSTLARDGLDAAIAERGTIYDLLWQRTGERFELAVEVVLPQDAHPPVDPNSGGEGYAIRYELAVGVVEAGTARILKEQVLLTEHYRDYPAAWAPEYLQTGSIFVAAGRASWRGLMHGRMTGAGLLESSRRGGRTSWQDLTHLQGASEYWLSVEDPTAPDGYTPVYRPNGRTPVFGSIGEAEFPTAIWLGNLLKCQVFRVDLQPEVLRQASRPGQGESFSRNGSNLPWMIERFEKSNASQFREWIKHVQTALPDVNSVKTIEREDDRARYLMVEYANGLLVPSWALSDGTLCMLALTFLAYQSKPGDVYLIEEPESHIHPLNIETVMQSLSSVYGGQVLISTHSPAVLALTDAEKVLVFQRDEQHGAQIVSGKDHPRLRDWKGEVNLGTLFASGVLG